MKILIKFSNEYIQFYDYDDFRNPEYSRTNVLDLQEIVLSDNFVDENYNFIYTFIKKKIIQDNINKVFIDKVNINKLVFKLIYNINNLNYFYINENKKVDVELFNYILTNKNIKIIDCYDINPITFERLNLSRNIKIITRKKYCDNSYLYRLNNLNTYSDIYYNEEIILDKLLQKRDLNKLNDYLKINKNLNILTIKFYDKNNLNDIIKMLNNNEKHNIRIEIQENNSNIKKILKSIDTIKDKNKKIIKKNKINIKIKYEDQYIKNNIFKELNLSFIKTILLFVIVLTLIVYGLFYIIEKENTNKTLNTTKKINDIVNSIKLEEPTPTKEPQKKKEEPKKVEKKQEIKYNGKTINELKKINKETVGWLSLNNTKISYPVVQAKNNEKYLTHSFDGTYNLNGWIFMDYRNNPKYFDRNTVIYGHSGNYYVMFGSLKNTLKASWYKNENNQYITFNTESSTKKWKIFSMYTIDVVSDYLVTEFESDFEYSNFLTRLKERSIYDFGVDLDVSDKILTLSTCHSDGSKRLVIHAKLMQ